MVVEIVFLHLGVTVAVGWLWRQVFENKRAALLKAIELNANSCERTIVFCNTIEQCRKVENILQREVSSFYYHIAGLLHISMGSNVCMYVCMHVGSE